MNKTKRVIIILAILIPLNFYLWNIIEPNYNDSYDQEELRKFDYCDNLDSDIAKLECFDQLFIREFDREVLIEKQRTGAINDKIFNFFMSNFLGFAFLFFVPEYIIEIKKEFFVYEN